MVTRGKIQFKTRTVTIHSLEQSNIYSGLLEGLPTREWNSKIISGTLAQLQKSNNHPYLVPPIEKPISYSHGKYPFGEPSELPVIKCIARCHSLSIRDDPCYASHLTLVWFQDDYAFPMDPLVVEHIRNLDWKRQAIDYEI